MQIIKPSYEILTPIDGMAMLKQIELAARTCYKSTDKITNESAIEKVKSLIKSGHEAMLEHGQSISIRFICDRGVSHEIVRHRLASFAQESTRYCNYSKNKFGNEITVIDLATGFNYDLTNPVDIKKYEIWKSVAAFSEKAYFEMLELGATPQEARSVLITSQKTEIIVTMNPRELRHFGKLRAQGTTGKPHPQMIEVAQPLFTDLKSQVPILFDDITF